MTVSFSRGTLLHGVDGIIVTVITVADIIMFVVLVFLKLIFLCKKYFLYLPVDYEI
jgi:hypothetical protein